MSNIKQLKTQLAAVEEEIYREYQERHKQDPVSRPRPDVGRLGVLWSHLDFLSYEIEQTEKEK